MKIDLHCHTKKVKSGDPITRNVSKEIFIDKLSDSSVSFVAITNHNHFDISQYNDFSNNDKDIIIFPGVELDIDGKESSGHCLLITSPKNVHIFNENLYRKIGSFLPDDFKMDIDDLLNFVKSGEYIVVPHYGSKSHSLCENDIDYIIKNISKVPVLLEPSNLRSAGIMIAHNKSTIIGSDVKDWTKYSESRLPEMKILISGFDHLLKLLKKDIPTIETFVKGKFAEEVHINPVKYPDCNLKINIYNDINVIFGGKGTGKTELILTCIKDHFERKGYNDVSTYFPNDSDKLQDFDSLKINTPKVNDLSKLTNNNLSKEFSIVNGHKTVSITSTSEYYKWLNSEKLKEVKFGFANAVFNVALKVYEKEYVDEKVHYQNTIETKNKMLTLVGEKYLTSTEIDQLKLLLEKIVNNSWLELVKVTADYHSLILTKWSIELFKKTYVNKKGVHVKPIQTGFISLFENSYMLYNSACSIKLAMETKPIFEKTAIGNIIGKGAIYREIEYSINPSSYVPKSTKHINQSITHQGIKLYSSSINKIVQNTFSDLEQSTINDFKTSFNQWNINDLSDLLLCNTRIIDENNIIYDASPGEKAMLLLNYKLMDDTKNVYILDEPESKVGHKYINDVIIPRLLELSRQDKKIILTTHDANIAVRTLPLTSIYREQYRVNSKVNYRTYIGSPFLDEMKCYEEDIEPIDWVITSMESLEGGENAFLERGENYGK